MGFPKLFLAFWLVFVAYWTVSAWGNKANTYRLNRVWRLLFLIVLFVLATLVKQLPSPYHQRILPPNAALQAVLALLCALGVAFAIWARRTLGTNWSANPTIKEGHELIQTGPYRWVRHPIYTGMALGGLSTLLAEGRLMDIPLALFVLLAAVAKMKTEEALMRRQFPEAYPAYMRRTKALIPFIL